MINGYRPSRHQTIRLVQISVTSLGGRLMIHLTSLGIQRTLEHLVQYQLIDKIQGPREDRKMVECSCFLRNIAIRKDLTFLQLAE